MASREYLHGHTSEDTAHVVEDYPYGFRLRTTIRYWIETTKRGDRFVSQTMDSRRAGVYWNKPKRSTYLAVAGMFLDDEGHVRWAGVNFNYSQEAIDHFVADYGRENLSDAQLAKLAEVVGYTRAMEHVTWEICDASSMTVEQVEQADVEQAQAKRDLGRLIAVKTHFAREELGV